MKRKKERRKAYGAKMHQKKKRVRVHLSKEAREKLGVKKRSLLVNKGDTVKVLRGGNRGKSAKVMRVSHLKGKLYLEGVSRRNARGVESLIPFDPSNLMITGAKETEFRKKLKGE